jgi:hypothetical protein
MINNLKINIIVGKEENFDMVEKLFPVQPESLVFGLNFFNEIFLKFNQLLYITKVCYINDIILI